MRVVDRELRRCVPLVGVGVVHVLVWPKEGPVAPRRSVGGRAQLEEEAILGPARGDPMHADVVVELSGVDRVRGVEKGVAAGRSGLAVRPGPAALAGERTVLGGRDEGLLIRDDLAGRARRGDGRRPGVREERQQEEADEERETAIVRASAYAQAPSLPLPPSPALFADCATGALVCTWSNERNA